MSAARHQVHKLPVRRVTPEGEHCFFGYYDKFATNTDDRLLAALRVPFMDHLPGPAERVEVGVVELGASKPRFVRLGHSAAWCWQQANMLQWLPEDPGRLLIYNDFRDGRYVSVVRDVEHGGAEIRVLPSPVYTLSQVRPEALFLNFSRVYSARPGYGYPNLPDPNAGTPAPANDGVWRMDVRSGKSELVLSIRQMAELAPQGPAGPGTFHWVNHIQINPGGTRFACLHRYRAPDCGRNWITRLITADMDGGNPRLLVPTPMVSHYDWFDDRRILAWARPGPLPSMFYIIDDRPRPPDCPVPFLMPFAPDVLRADGHCSFSPDRRFFVNDTYPGRDRCRTLMLVRRADQLRIDIARLYAPPEIDGEHRCDLHPNWFRNGNAVCVDSAHEGFRGIYVLDVSQIVGED
ncbi:MAG: hypothetical protein GXP31_01390 [Kiritimatiellaeota bacterium]|nr:hypothetical protein [Kiritimatiellota bacterium]